MNKKWKLDIEIERKVLAYLINNPKEIFDVPGTNFTLDCFTHLRTKVCFLAIQSYTNETWASENDPLESQIPSLILSSTILDKYNHIAGVNEENKEKWQSFINEVYDENVSKTEYLTYTKRIFVSLCKRRLEDATKEIVKEIQPLESIGEIISTAETHILDATKKSLTKESDIEIIGQNYEDFLAEREERAKAGNLKIGIETPFSKYNEAIGGGFRPGTISVLAARSKMGKCIDSEHSVIYTENGLFHPWELHNKNSKEKTRIDVDYKVLSEDGTKVMPSYWWNNGVSETIKITTKSGIVIETTRNHPIRVLDNNANIVWKNAENITNKDIVVVRRGDNVWGNKNIDKDDAYTIGCIVGDGFIRSPNKAQVSMTTKDKYIAKMFEKYVRKNGGYVTHPNKLHYYCSQKGPTVKMDLGYYHNNLKIIPKSIRECDCETICNMLSGLFDTDGGVEKRGVTLTTKSFYLKQQVHSILLNLGIVPRCRTRQIKIPNKNQRKTYYEIRISSYNNLVIFRDKISFRLKRKQAQLKKLMSNIKSSEKHDCIPNIKETPKAIKTKVMFIRDYSFKGHRSKERDILNQGLKRNIGFTGDFIKTILKEWECASHTKEYDKINKLCDRHLFFDSIKNIEKGECQTCDFHIPETHSFVANGIINHNSWIACKIADHVARQGVPVLYLDTELENNYQSDRRCSQSTEVPINILETAAYLNNPQQGKKVADAIQDFRKHPVYYVDIKGWGLDQQINAIRRFFATKVRKKQNGEYNDALVILDYLKLMRAGEKGADKEWEALGYRMTILHDLMGSYGQPMFALAQQNRDGLDKEDESTISGSDRIIYLCDNFTIFSRLSDADIELHSQEAEDSPFNEEDEEVRVYNTKLRVVVCRHGPGTKGGYISMYADIHDPKKSYDKVCGILEEGPKRIG